MILKTIDFVGSFPTEQQCPPPKQPEYAFIGRSNVGKSSLINMMCDRKDLAHVSGQPGKTQYLNYYKVNEEWYIVDLPGYGYAKISKKKRAEWKRMMDNFFKYRHAVQCVFILIDINVKPQKIDLEFINQLGEWNVPFVIVYTKADRLKPAELSDNLEIFRTAMLETWTEMPQEFITSAAKKTGRLELLNFIDGINEEYYKVFEK